MVIDNVTDTFSEALCTAHSPSQQAESFVADVNHQGVIEQEVNHGRSCISR